MILLIDNYDSFTYNIYQMIGAKHPDIMVVRNDKISLSEIRSMAPQHIILSPGPGYPSEAGNMPRIINAFSNTIPILGICLGHQGIAENFGAKIIKATLPIHGKNSEVEILETNKLFAGLPKKVNAARYHSLTVEAINLPDCLQVIATSTSDGQIMALRHNTLPVYGLQFHPESILSEYGEQILDNFISYL